MGAPSGTRHATPEWPKAGQEMFELASWPEWPRSSAWRIGSARWPLESTCMAGREMKLRPKGKRLPSWRGRLPRPFLTLTAALLRSYGRVPEEVITHSAEETTNWGRQFARRVKAPVLILLTGDLGTGKTTLTKGLVAGLGAAREDDVTSPTFTLVHITGRTLRFTTPIYTALRIFTTLRPSVWRICSPLRPSLFWSGGKGFPCRIPGRSFASGLSISGAMPAASPSCKLRQDPPAGSPLTLSLRTPSGFLARSYGGC